MHMATWGKELGGRKVKGRAFKGEQSLALSDKAIGLPSGSKIGLHIRDEGEKASFLFAAIQPGVSCGA